MTDLTRRLLQAGRHLTVAQHELDLAAGEARLRRDLDRRRKLRAGAGVTVALLLVGGAGVLLRARERRSLATEATGTAMVGTATSVAPRTVWFEDGSRASLVEGTELQRIPAPGGADLVLHLRVGTAHFEVARRDGRVFRVLAGTVTIDAVGTSFSVQRVADGARVTVQDGRVKVAWADGQRYLDVGDSGRFPPANPAENEARAPAQGPAIGPLPAPAVAPAPVAAPAAAKPSWLTLAQAGEHARAYEALGRAGPAAVKDEPGDLLTAADVARLSGHPLEARAPLRRILRRHRSDPRAGLAAFTLGRVLLEETYDPRGAADAFALVRTLEPQSPLVEDAWAREVEALARAGAADEAKARAQEYLRRFPTAAKAKQVRRIAGLR